MHELIKGISDRDEKLNIANNRIDEILTDSNSLKTSYDQLKARMIITVGQCEDHKFLKEAKREMERISKER